MQTTAQITDIIYFHGMTLPVITFENVKYIPAKPIVDAIGLDWRSAKKSILEEDNAILYGTKWINAPKIAGLGGASTPSEDQTVCFELEHARSYIMRVNTRQVKAQGNKEAAKQIQALQKEWSTAIHNYETKGIASKDKSKTDTAELMNLMKLRQMASSIEKQAFTQLLHQKMAELGLPISQQQLDLLDQ